ncbi:MAG: 4-hydroxybenzoate polyprenyltransferase [Gammaproteobacteria bacterium RIFCSPHIGHO2_12_FULL_41_15]|nr:MAG: 4-hydroxybenzoate polyprenyltransferase [Gammaproteobacteria bacterium RIFCSPHIGHO2_12_FULL_41_15]
MNAYLRLMRFDKPIGIFLLAWPMLWALWLAAGGLPSLTVLLVFVAGAVLMRAAGCIINDVADRKIDGHVQRTMLRPLVSGEAAPLIALLLFVGLLLVACALVLTQNRLTIGLACLAPIFVILYPFTKRFTHLPQLFLGLAFAWAVPMAFAAVLDSVPAKAWVVYLLALIWPVMYDTQYAMVDREDDVKIGVKSTAILFGRFDRWALGFLQVLLWLLILWVGYLFHLNFWFFLGSFIILIDFAYQQYLTFERNRAACLKAFLHNNWLGLLIFLLVVFGGRC